MSFLCLFSLFSLTFHPFSTFFPLSFHSLLFLGQKALFLPSNTPLISPTTEVIIFVGFPGCGKSSFYERHLKAAGYVHVNQDTLKSRDQCVAAVRRAISAGKSAVVGTKKYYYCYCDIVV